MFNFAHVNNLVELSLFSRQHSGSTFS